ncbi:hypothetical protein CASFOL_007739 [Castilleja foliolosa]|uniref:NAD(P)H-quinone oxidoreductase subunit 5, chloroplastic n=1 Tax=Castilleja foliolosa TaxID=1961234 RepID=A0ABD3E1E8_9LAMI
MVRSSYLDFSNREIHESGFIELEEILFLDEMIKDYSETHLQKIPIGIHKETIQLIMLFPLLVLVLFTLFVGFLGIPFNQEGTGLDILSKWLAPSINLLHQKLRDSAGWYEFLKDATFSRS